MFAVMSARRPPESNALSTSRQPRWTWRACAEKIAVGAVRAAHQVENDIHLIDGHGGGNEHGGIGPILDARALLVDIEEACIDLADCTTSCTVATRVNTLITCTAYHGTCGESCSGRTWLVSVCLLTVARIALVGQRNERRRLSWEDDALIILRNKDGSSSHMVVRRGKRRRDQRMLRRRHWYHYGGGSSRTYRGTIWRASTERVDVLGKIGQ